MLVTNVELKGRQFEYFEPSKTEFWRKERKYVMQIGAMLIKCCYEEIPYGISDACFSMDGYIYKANYSREPMCAIFASGNPEKMAQEDQAGVTTRIGDILYVKGSEFKLFDLSYGPRGGADAVILRVEDYMEAIIKVNYQNDEGQIDTTYYIFNGRTVYMTKKYEDLPIVARLAGLKGKVMESIYSRHAGTIKEADVLEKFILK